MTQQTAAPNDLPAPLTPIDCDLRGMLYMPVDVVALTESDFALTSAPAGFKAAVLLWCCSWRQVPAASLPDDDRMLAILSRTGPRWKKLRAEALHGFVKCSDQRLYHPKVAEKALVAWHHRLKQQARAKVRWDSRGSATALPRHNRSDAAAMQEKVKVNPPQPPTPPAQIGEAAVLSEHGAKVLQRFAKVVQG